MQLTHKIRRFTPLVIIVVIAIVGSVIYLTHIYLDLLSIIRIVLNSGCIEVFFWILSVCASILYYFTTKGKESSEILFRLFGPFIDGLLSGITYATLIQTSVVVLRGIFNQWFFKETHFFGFSSWDLVVMGLCMGYLLYWAFMRVYKMVGEAIMTREIGEIKITPPSQREGKD